jgi:hypothetical protein
MALADDAFTERGATYAVLHATAQGALYADLGWAGTSEMARSLHGNDQTP